MLLQILTLSAIVLAFPISDFVLELNVSKFFNNTKMEGKNVKIRRRIAAILLMAAVFLCAASVQAHQLRLVEGAETPVKDPETAQIFYGVLKGTDQTYVIDSAQPFLLYAQLGMPDLAAEQPDVTAAIYTLEETPEADGKSLQVMSTVARLRVAEGARQYHEPLLGDNYLLGDEFRANQDGQPRAGVEMPAGKYYIKVYGAEASESKYALMLGTREDLSPSGLWTTLKNLPRIETEFWGKSPFAALLSPLGLGILLLFALLVGLLWRRRKARRKKKLLSGKTKEEEEVEDILP